MNVLVYEHACGGGFAEGAVSPSILSEGFGMLRSCVADLKEAGHKVTVILDEELSLFNPPIEADYVIPIFNFKDAQQAILKTCTNVDAAYVIAPETGGILHALVKFIEQQGVPLLNSHSNAIQTVSDKVNLYETLRVNSLRTPKTVQVKVAQYREELFVNDIGFPAVFKPIDGMGCSGLSVVEKASQVEGAVRKIVSELGSEVFIIQEYIAGVAISVSLLCTDKKVMAISLNEQNVALSSPNGVSCYIGGVVPFFSEAEQEIFKIAEAVVGCFSGLKGYVGVDMILTDTGPVVVDVNPRLTTSFIGLSRVTDFNFTNAIADAALKNVLPSKVAFLGYACFSKLETPNADIDVLDKLCKISEVISLPFPIQDSKRGCALLSAECVSLDEAKCRLKEAKRQVLDLFRSV
ncbi:MAG: ATP-grasp domain-containing protein [Candidatus Bathyarchaeota archaeon]|nr:ATP-grasp domain-containing protein [Candidatus Termiticorpusculum sp.]